MSIQSHVSAYKASVDGKQAAIDSLIKEFKGKRREFVIATLKPCIAKSYDIKLIEGERKAKGTMVLDKSSANYEAARDALYVLVTAIKGRATSSSTEEVTFTKAQLKLAKAYLEQFDSKAKAIKALNEIAQ
jgi:hypothetical protein